MSPSERAVAICLKLKLPHGAIHYVAAQLRQAEGNVRAATILELDAKYNAYCEKRVKEALDYAAEQVKKVDRAIDGMEVARENHNRRSTDRQV